MANFIQLVLTGVLDGSLVALMALGISLIYRTTGILNLSQGALAAFSAFIMYAVANRVPLLLAVVVGIVVAMALGAVIGASIGGRLAHGSPVIAVVATLALGLLLDQITQQIWGATGTFFTSFSAAIGTAPVQIGSISLLRVEVWGFVVAIVLVGIIFALLRLTALGLALRAVADQPEAARLSGIPTPLVRMLSWSLGAGLAAVAGFFVAAHLLYVVPVFMESYLIAALIAVVIGGLGSLPGAALGAVLVSVAEFIFVGYAPSFNLGGHSVALSAFINTFLFVVLIAVLVVAPRGLLGGARMRSV